MTHNRMPIIAAIPNYNMAHGLARLLPMLVTQGYDAIYVLDDASTDDSRSVVARHSSVQWVSSKKNTGSGGARNMILNHINEPTIIHFLDADVMPNGDDFPQKIRALELSDNIGFIGGLVIDESGQQSIWNYGPQLTIGNGIKTLGYMLLCALPSRFSRGMLSRLTSRPRGKMPVHPYWVIEANFIVTSETLKKYGAFDENIREHDIQPLAARVSKAGLTNGFIDSISVTQHNDMNVRNYNRLFALYRSEWYVARHYIGWRYLSLL